jgi:hypothetical protein
MATVQAPMSKETAVQALAAAAAVFGVAGLLTPRVLEGAYAVPASPYTRQMLRLFGSRMLALAAWARSADTPEDRNTLLTVACGMNALDALTAVLAPGEPAATRIRAALTSGLFGAIAGYARTLPD